VNTHEQTESNLIATSSGCFPRPSYDQFIDLRRGTTIADRREQCQERHLNGGVSKSGKANAGQEMERELRPNIRWMTPTGLFFGKLENKMVQVGAKLTRFGVNHNT
jgi:hypothetical protein